MTSILGYPRKSESEESKRSAAIEAAKRALFPVGSVYMAVVSTNPASLVGFGQWTSLGSGTITIGGVASTKTMYVWERVS